MSQRFQESKKVNVKRWSENEGYSETSDYLAEEIPVALIFNGISHAVMMMTPSNLEQFVVGFSLTEGIIDKASQIYGIDIKQSELSRFPSIEVMIETASEVAWRLAQQKRTLAGRTGCGLCGIDSLEQAVRPVSTVQTAASITDETINKALNTLQEYQLLQQQTGAVHAAAWFSVEGKLHQVCEDVGRHNALDKLIGHMVKDALDPTQGFLLMSCRGSYEIVHKAAAAGIGNVVTISAPTALAAQLAEDAGIKLIGFARPGRHVEYLSP